MSVRAPEINSASVCSKTLSFLCILPDVFSGEVIVVPFTASNLLHNYILHLKVSSSVLTSLDLTLADSLRGGKAVVLYSLWKMCCMPCLHLISFVSHLRVFLGPFIGLESRLEFTRLCALNTPFCAPSNWKSWIAHFVAQRFLPTLCCQIVLKGE